MTTKKTRNASSPGQQTSTQKLDALTEALDDVPMDAEDVRETVAKLGVDVNALAKGIRAKIGAAAASLSHAEASATGVAGDEGATGVTGESFKGARPSTSAHASSAEERRQRISEARATYAKEVAELEHRRVEPERSREEQLAIFEGLLKKAPPHTSLAMHFHKYEAASKEELAELIRGLRYLLGEDDDS